MEIKPKFQANSYPLKARPLGRVRILASIYQI